MRNLIKKILKESSDDLGWVDDVIKEVDNCEDTVVVIYTGGHYSSYLDAMGDLNVPGASERVNKLRKKYNIENVSDFHKHRKHLINFESLKNDHWEALQELKSTGILGEPEVGDICCLTTDIYRNQLSNSTVRRLVRLKDGKNFIIADDCYKPYRGSLKENAEDLDWVKDYTQYLKVGQKFFLKTSTSPAKIKVKIIKKDDNNVWMSPTGMANRRGWKGRKTKNEFILKSIIEGSLEPIE